MDAVLTSVLRNVAGVLKKRGELYTRRCNKETNEQMQHLLKSSGHPRAQASHVSLSQLESKCTRSLPGCLVSRRTKKQLGQRFWQTPLDLNKLVSWTLANPTDPAPHHAPQPCVTELCYRLCVRGFDC